MRDRLYRFLTHVSGVDYERLKTGPLGDKQFAMRIGLQLVFSSAFLLAIFTSSLLVGFGGNVLSSAVVVVMAFITTAVVALLDASIIASDNHEHGLELARDRGFDDGVNPTWAKIKRRAVISLRLALSIVIGLAFATFFELRLFGSDIARQIDSDYRRANAALFQNVQARYDANIKSLEGDIAGQDKALNVLDQQKAELRSKLFGSSEANTDTELTAALENLGRLTAEKEARDAEALRREGDAVNEANGVKESADQSGRAGKGLLYQNAKGRAEIASRESARLAGEIVSVQSAVTALRERQEREAEKTRSLLDAGLQKITDEESAIHANRDDLSSRRDQALTTREASVLAIAQNTPEYAPKVDGFLARVEALDVLQNRPAVAHISFLATLVIMLVDIAAVLSKVFFSVPTLHAVGAAIDFEETAGERATKARKPVRRGRAASVRDEIEVEELRGELAEKRAARQSKEAATWELYSQGDDNKRDAA